jgi:hypothetical protein
MRVGKKTRQKTPKRTDESKEPERPSGGKFAPIIEELGKMKTRLESGAVTFAPRPLSLQEKTQLEIEGELIQREQTVREDFGTVFRDNPQALVEFMAAMRKYGDDEVLRDLVFAAETLYGGEVDRMPGGVQFWEGLKKEVGTIPYEPGANADDERLHRILAVEILREAALSYDIISSEMEEEGEQVEEADEGPKDQSPASVSEEGRDGGGKEPASEALSAAKPAEAAPVSQSTEAGPAAPRGGAEGRIYAQLELMARKDADIRQALVELGRREAMLQKEMERLQSISLQSIDTEEKLKLEREELVQREERLLGIEREFSEREKKFLEAEEDVQRRLSGHEEERGRLLERERELVSSLDEARSQHARAQDELAALRKEAEQGRNAMEEGRLMKEALFVEKRGLEEERARLADLHSRFEAEQERQKKLQEELAQRAAFQGELDLKEKRLKVMEDETAALRSEVGLRQKELVDMEQTLKREAEKWERDLGAREDRLAVRERELSEREAQIAGQPKANEPATAASEPAPAPSPGAISPSVPSPAMPVSPAPSPPSAGKGQSSLAPPPSPPLLPHRREPPLILPPEPADESTPVSKVKCPGCKTIIVVSSRERPLRIKCGTCGKEGVIK